MHQAPVGRQGIQLRLRSRRRAGQRLVRHNPAARAQEARDPAQGPYRIGLMHQERPREGKVERPAQRRRVKIVNVAVGPVVADGNARALGWGLDGAGGWVRGRMLACSCGYGSTRCLVTVWPRSPRPTHPTAPGGSCLAAPRVLGHRAVPRRCSGRPVPDDRPLAERAGLAVIPPGLRPGLPVPRRPARRPRRGRTIAVRGLLVADRAAEIRLGRRTLADYRRAG